MNSLSTIITKGVRPETIFETLMEKWYNPIQTFLAGVLTASFLKYFGSLILSHLIIFKGVKHDKKNNSQITERIYSDILKELKYLSITFTRYSLLYSLILWNNIKNLVVDYRSIKEEKNACNDHSILVNDTMNFNKSLRETISAKKNSESHIGSICGLDVGGTLAKLVYFEKLQKNKRVNIAEFIHENVFTEYNRLDGTNLLLNPKGLKRQKCCSNISPSKKLTSTFSRCNIPIQDHFSINVQDITETPLVESQKYPIFIRLGATKSTTIKINNDNHITPWKALKYLPSKTRHILCSEEIDIQQSENEMGVKENCLSFFSQALGGEFHFFQFETRHMSRAMNLIRENNLHQNIVQMGATGGGAHKFSAQWEQGLGIKMVKQDEWDCLVAGMQFVLSDIIGECYTFKPNEQVNFSVECMEQQTIHKDYLYSIRVPRNHVKYSKESNQNLWSRKVRRDIITKRGSYPYMLVIIGTGVSVLRVDGPRKYERISGSTIGGGTYWGLCRLLTDVEDFESVLNLSERGDPSKVDM